LIQCEEARVVDWILLGLLLSWGLWSIKLGLCLCAQKNFTKIYCQALYSHSPKVFAAVLYVPDYTVENIIG
jgi:uncharacterized membrane protein YpjA